MAEVERPYKMYYDALSLPFSRKSARDNILSH